jgi:PAS domain S-box-containing protein
MAVGDADELIRSLKALPVAAILTDLPTHTFIAANERAGAVFGTPPDDLVGTDVLTRIHPNDREAARAGYAAMAGKVIDGYQVQRRIVRPDGSELIVSISGRRVGDPGTPVGLWVLVPGPEPPTPIEMPVVAAPAVVLAVTNHDWQIEYVSSDAELLGTRGSELRGFPLIGLVHPSAATEFLAAAAKTATDHLAVTTVTRMRAGRENWADRYCLMVRMCEHQPPRLGIVISAGPTALTLDNPGNQLNEYVRQAAVEARAVRNLDALPALAQLPPGSELSARQTEIVARLVAGQRPAEIAQSMFLSPSTVRNHLAAIYRKFGVHSLAELLAALLRAVAYHGQ